MVDIWMDVDTALAEVPVNIMPLLDDTDFKTRETAIAYDAAGMDLVWNFVTTGGAFTQTAVTPTTAGNYDWAHQGDGMYTIEIPASGGASINNDTEGFGWFTGVVTGVLPWRGPIIGFRAAALNNSLVDGATLDVNVTAIANDVITASAIAADAIGASEFAQAAADKIWSSTTRTLTALGASLVQEIWDRATSALTTAGSIGKLIVDNLNATILSRAAASTALSNATWTDARGGYLDNLNIGGTVASQASVNTIDDLLDTEIATIIADLDDIQTRLPAALTTGTANSGSTTTMVDAARSESDTDYWKGCWIRFTSGNLAGQVRLITAFTPASDTITFAPATTQAVSTHTYEILPAARIDVGLWLSTLPSALISGRVDANIQAMGNDVLTAAALAADAVTEIQSGLATAAGVSAVEADTQDIQAKIGTPAGASLSADIAVIEAQTDEIGAAGAGLTAIPSVGAVTGAVGSVTGNVGGNVVGSVASVTNGVSISDSGMSTTLLHKIADRILRRSLASAEASADGDTLGFRSLLGAISKLVNRVAISGSMLTVYRTDDSTSLGTQAVTTSAGADPISEVNTN